MARQSQDREDLLRDATAFAARVQLSVRLGGQESVVFAGFRTSDAASIYFNQDPVYHFNASGQLRRAYVDERLVKAEAGNLVRWHRRQGEGEVAMLREELSVESQEQLLQAAGARLSELHQRLVENKFKIEGQVGPPQAQAPIETLTCFLSQLRSIEIAANAGLSN